MKQFFKFTFASMLGFFLSFFLIGGVLFIFTLILLAGLQSSQSNDIPSDSVLEIKLDYSIPERTNLHPLYGFGFFPIELSRDTGLNDIIKSIRSAKNDDDIHGIYLNLDNFVAGGVAVLESIRREIIDFKKSGKFVFAYGNNISQRAYYLASAADKIFMSPEGIFEFKGLSAEYMFFKKTLDKLDINAQIFRHGEFKSAIEPFNSERMSEANKKQTTEYVNSIYEVLLKNISASRNISVDSLDYYADNLVVRTSGDAVKFHLIDSAMYMDQLLDLIKKESGIRKNKKVSFVRMENYPAAKSGRTTSGKSSIAIIYAVGDIESGDGSESSIGIRNISEALRRVREDDRIKAVVFRVNSSGGDAITSDLIWREVQITKEKKPIVVSMGSVAASGGYYISCAADSIVAEANTITGSIGVFGIIPDLKSFFDNKLGITFDRVTTGKHSDLFTVSRPLNAEEREIIQDQVERLYNTFVSKVSEGRNLSYEEVDKIAQGRVWTGKQAKEIGLVDAIGGLDDAIKMAAKMAKVDKYSIVEYPYQKGLLKTLIEDLTYSMKSDYLKSIFGNDLKEFETIKRLKDLNGFQARLLYDINIY